MKILFICGSLEPGNDGVGDYVNVLSQRLIKNNVEVGIVALNDVYIKHQIELIREDGCRIYRLSHNSSWQHRMKGLHNFFNTFDPGFVSLHFVPYAFHSKGIPLLLAWRLKCLDTSCKWHIMFHELWIGDSKNSSFKNRFIGRLQRQCILNLLKVLKPKVISTNTEFFKIRLDRFNFETTLLPVFSNLPGANQDSSFLRLLPSELVINREKYIVGIFFGSMNIDFSFEKSLLVLNDKVKELNKELYILHVGRGELAMDILISIQNTYGIAVKFLGQQSGQDIANIFKMADLGLSVYPKILFEKSGSIAAMLNNGLPIVLLSKSFQKDLREFNYLKEIEETFFLQDLIVKEVECQSIFDARVTLDFYIKNL